MEKIFPKISIVTPSFNQGEYIESTIKSVLDQNYPNLEYIIIDGGSKDCTLDVIKQYDHQLSYWESCPDEGMYHAINKGFAKSTGEIMAWINSDDMYHANCLFTIAELFSQFSSIKWITGSCTFLDEKNRTVSVSPARQWSLYDVLNNDWKYIQQESTIWRRSLWDKAGGYVSTEYKYASDFELWMRFFLNEKLFVIDTLIGGFRCRSSNQISRDNLNEYHSEGEQIIQSTNLRLNPILKRKVKKAGTLRKKQLFFRKLKMLSISRYFERKFEKLADCQKIHFSPILLKFVLRK